MAALELARTALVSATRARSGAQTHDFVLW